jgi:hypothetical protein
MSYSKKAQADMHGVTSSTVAFTSARVDADNEEDSDSGHNSDELNVTSQSNLCQCLICVYLLLDSQDLGA